MRYFVVASAIIFGLLLLAHVARFFAEGMRILHEPIFVASSALALGMAIWAIVLLVRQPRS